MLMDQGRAKQTKLNVKADSPMDPWAEFGKQRRWPNQHEAQMQQQGMTGISIKVVRQQDLEGTGLAPAPSTAGGSLNNNTAQYRRAIDMTLLGKCVEALCAVR